MKEYNLNLYIDQVTGERIFCKTFDFANQIHSGFVCYTLCMCQRRIYDSNIITCPFCLVFVECCGCCGCCLFDTKFHFFFSFVCMSAIESKYAICHQQSCIRLELKPCGAPNALDTKRLLGY